MNEIIRRLTGLPMTALICSLIFTGIIIFCYKVIYKGIFKGKKNVGLSKLLAGAFLIGYIIIVVLFTVVREPSFYHASNLVLFSSYTEAINLLPDTMALWLLIFNICMFIPVGLLLPIVSERFKSFSITMIFAVCFTYIIEISQYIIGSGIFELDDLINNILGAVIGYSIYMIIHKLTNKENSKEQIIA